MTEPNEEMNEELVDGGAAGEALGSVNFDVNEEFKAPPLIPKGTYHGVAVATKFSPAQFCIVWEFNLHDNGGVQNDGVTPIDGSHVFSRNWLPKPGDEDIPTKKGNMSKRQSKINMLKDFQDALMVDMSTPNAIAQALTEGTWIGTEADLEVDIEEWQGRFRNVVNRVKKTTLY